MKDVLVPHLNKTLKFGSRRRPPADQIAKVPRLKNYMKLTAEVPLPTPPTTFDYSQAAAPCLSQVMGNDQYGDCTCAGASHALGIWTGNAGNLVTLTTEQTLKMYSDITGFNPSDPSTDQGANELDVLNYLMTTGFPSGDKLAGYCVLDGTNQAEVTLAAWLSECLYFGVELPDAWISPFPSASGFVWDVAQPDENNGHCIIGTGIPTSVGVQVDSWGLLGTMTWGAVAALTSEGTGGQMYALFSESSINRATGKAPTGFDWKTLLADFETLKIQTRGGIIAA